MTSAQASMDTIEASDEHLALTCSLLYTSRAVQEATRVSRQQRKKNGTTECLLGLVEGKKEWRMNGTTEFVISLNRYEATFRNREDYSESLIATLLAILLKWIL
ncbi:hypothetical protein BDA96_06G036800 [Sorghum bicolor]|uniref:Uncharacterized protein n=2 Tax=Sorghum bicolor TaxID=4558 RepID=A0A921QQV8_SORBI|nr:hypothetical protein BDA96_06G036800 [Sorghum bicolor]OQU81256.1 hypothetical protein SORBI_3006G033601 [Sorghum bicolor]